MTAPVVAINLSMTTGLKVAQIKHAVGRSNISTSTGYHNNNNMSVGPRLPGAYMTAPVASSIMISFRGANDSLPATPVRVAKLNWSEGCTYLLLTMTSGLCSLS